jgi:hypothetical protein
MRSTFAAFAARASRMLRTKKRQWRFLPRAQLPTAVNAEQFLTSGHFSSENHAFLASCDPESDVIK